MNDIVAGVRAFMTRFPGTRVEGLPDDESPSLQERLAHLGERPEDPSAHDHNGCALRLRYHDGLLAG